MSKINELADDLFREIEHIVETLGNEAEQHYSAMVTAYREIAMLEWYTQLQSCAPEQRSFKIIARPGEESEQTYLFTGTLTELKDELFRISLITPPNLEQPKQSPTQVKYGNMLSIGQLYQAKDDVEVVEATILNPVPYLITMYPLNSK